MAEQSEREWDEVDYAVRSAAMEQALRQQHQLVQVEHRRFGRAGENPSEWLDVFRWICSCGARCAEWVTSSDDAVEDHDDHCRAAEFLEGRSA